MRNLILFTLCFLLDIQAFSQDTASRKFNDTLMLQNIEVTSVRASNRAPFTKTNMSRQQIEERNTGEDLPFILNLLPSVVAGSDAGNGVGYTNLRIRGSDATRINVTLNGIPFNDAESQGTFFVNMPDIASSVSSIQVQRGAGTSSNGSGAFGATVNLSTNEVNKEKYLNLNNAFGSFNTWKNTIKAGTGLINNHFTLDARFSNITSDGYIDRATSSLQSYFVSGAYLNKNTSVRFNLISGKEKTYQAWNGVPESLLKTDRTYNSAGTEKPGTPYDNEIDHYRQTHYQIFLNQNLSDKITFNVGTFLVRGKGYYENYKAGQKFSKYNLPDVIEDGETISRTDLILQRWLDNYFYGSIFSGQYAYGKNQLTFGGGISRYHGKHFNMVKWAEVGIPENYSSYHLPAGKNDYNFYAKWMHTLASGFTTFIDLQQRFVDYRIDGFKDHPDIRIHEQYAFFNPKIGMSYLTGSGLETYLSFSIAAKEPNREDYEAGINNLPKPERMYDWEAGFTYQKKNYSAGVNLYLMRYHNQLVNTGEINDVGAFTRTNAARSYRAGIEVQAGVKPAKWMDISGNISFSRNKISSFTEYIYDDDEKETQNHFNNTDISYSPSVVAGGMINFYPFKDVGVQMISKYVGSQFLDNTSDKGRMLKSYFVEDIRLNYTFSRKVLKKVQVYFQVNNLFDKLYESNGYTYNYISNGHLYVENFYFPMAKINFTGGVNIEL